MSQKEVSVLYEDTTISTVTGNFSYYDSLLDGCSVSGSDSNSDDRIVVCQENAINQKIKSLKKAMGSDLISQVREMYFYERRSIVASF